MDIMTFIPKGKENAIGRNELVYQLCLPDRTVRKLIQEARDRGEVILNDQDGRGYYTSDDLDELERQYRANQNRAMSILRQQKYLRRKMKETAEREGGQIFFSDEWVEFKTSYATVEEALVLSDLDKEIIQFICGSAKEEVSDG